MSSDSYADELLSPRIQIGLNLIPAIIAADKNLNSQSKNNPLKLQIVYIHNKQRALKSEKQLKSIGMIRGHKLKTEVISFKKLLEKKQKRNCVLILIEKMDLELNSLIQYSRNQKIILFSPFKGDVEKGVMSGFEVSNKVLPAINIKAARTSNIDLKAFFLRIAIKYDQ